MKLEQSKSIHTKFLRATFIIIFVLSAVLSLVSVLSVSKISNDDSELLVSLVCDREAYRFDNKFNIVEHSVENIHDYAVEIQNYEGMEDVCSEEYLESVRKMSISIANRTDGAIAVYFRYDPNLVGNGTKGFFWSRENDNESFSYEEPTDILIYEKNDTEHVGWFYQPKNKGKATWISPYLNKNINVFMISYVVPFYTKSGDFVGVIGMDIDFNDVMKLADRIDLYETGNASLVDMSEHLMYYSDKKGNYKAEKLSTDLYNHITTINNKERTLTTVSENNEKFVICNKKLANGMRLVVEVPLNEIYYNRDNLIIWSVILFIIMLLVSIIIVRRKIIKVISPLRKITEITNKYAQGDWSEDYICNTNDELQVLSESVAAMAKTTRSYINDINKMAKTDFMTGMNNNNRFLEYVENEIKNRTDLEYGIVICDINNLKKTNDTYGHEAGDELIIKTANYINLIFQNSLTFRVGGDEFAVILKDESYINRKSLIELFEEELQKQPPVMEGVPLAIAIGMAATSEKIYEFDDIYKLADERMYENKRRKKACQ